MNCFEKIQNVDSSLFLGGVNDNLPDEDRKAAFIKNMFGECEKGHYSKRWYNNFFDLLEFIYLHGHSNVPSVYKNSRKLGDWVSLLRKNYQLLQQGESPDRAKLTEKRIWMLNQINFNWDPKGEEFNSNFTKLLKYKQIYKHVHIDTNIVEDDEFRCLPQWVKSIRSAYLSYSKGVSQKYLTPERIIMLEEIGFQWTVDDGKANKQNDM